MKRSRWEDRITQLYPPARAELSIVLASIASASARRVTRGSRHGVSQHEVTLTQSALLEMARRVPFLHINPFTQTAESKNGADWEWWVRGGSSWFGYRVQAKRLIDDAYSFDHLIGGDPARPQLKQLIDSSTAVGISAVFALYNPAAPPGTHSTHGGNGCFPARAEGVTIVDAQYIANGFGAKKAARAMVRNAALPWSCLAGCACWCPSDTPPHSGTLDTSLAPAVAAALDFDGPMDDPAFLAVFASLARRRAHTGLNADTHAISAEPTGWFADQPPLYVQAAQDAPGRAIPGELYAEVTRSDESAPPGYVIIQSR